MCANLFLAAAPVPTAAGEWVFPFSWMPLYGCALLAPNLKSKSGRKMLLWHRRGDSARHPGYARYSQAEKPLF